MRREVGQSEDDIFSLIRSANKRRNAVHQWLESACRMVVVVVVWWWWFWHAGVVGEP